jgi:hypothetical protein
LTVLPKSFGRDEPLHLLIDSTGLKIYGVWRTYRRGKGTAMPDRSHAPGFDYRPCAAYPSGERTGELRYAEVESSGRARQ